MNSSSSHYPLVLFLNFILISFPLRLFNILHSSDGAVTRLLTGRATPDRRQEISSPLCSYRFGSTQLLVKCAPGTFSQGVKRQRQESGSFLLFSAEIKNARNYIPAPPRVSMACLTEQSNNFFFTSLILKNLIKEIFKNNCTEEETGLTSG